MTSEPRADGFVQFYMMVARTRVLVLALLLAASCTTAQREVAVWYAMPGPPGNHYRVEIAASGQYLVRSKRRSYHMSDPMKGIAFRTGRISRDELHTFIESLRHIGLDGIDQERIHRKRHEEKRRRLGMGESAVIFIADGGDYSFDIDAHGLSFRFEGNAVPGYAEAYPDIAELQTLARAVGMFQTLTERLWEQGQPATEPPGS
jgi:hypothetical protein